MIAGTEVGLFTSENKYWLNDGYGHKTLKTNSAVQRNQELSSEGKLWRRMSGRIYFVRLQRDGWLMKPLVSDSEFTVFEKPLSHGWVLPKICSRPSWCSIWQGLAYWDEHELEQARKTANILMAQNGIWADIDGKKLLCGTKTVALFRAIIKRSGIYGEPKLLFNFNDIKIQAIQAPY